MAAWQIGVLFVGATLPTTACSSRTPAQPPPSVEAVPPSDAPVDPVSGNPASIVGLAPIAVNDMPSVVVLKPRFALKSTPQRASPMMDQVAHIFTPGVLVVRTGQPASFRNDDDVLHNVRVRERDRTDDWVFNVVLPQGGAYVHTFERDGVYDVRCDMHQSMWARVVAVPTPYGVVADRDGTFRIDDVAPGSYTLVVYAGDRTIERSIELAEGQGLRLSVERDPTDARPDRNR